MALPVEGDRVQVAVDPAKNGGSEVAYGQVIRTFQDRIADPAGREGDMITADLASVIAFVDQDQPLYLRRVHLCGSKSAATRLLDKHRALVPAVRGDNGERRPAPAEAVYQWVQVAYPVTDTATAPAAA